MIIVSTCLKIVTRDPVVAAAGFSGTLALTNIAELSTDREMFSCFIVTSSEL